MRGFEGIWRCTRAAVASKGSNRLDDSVEPAPGALTPTLSQREKGARL